MTYQESVTTTPNDKIAIYDIIREGFKNKTPQSKIAEQLNAKGYTGGHGSKFSQSTVSQLERNMGIRRGLNHRKYRPYKTAKKNTTAPAKKIDTSTNLIQMMKDVLSAAHQAETEKTLLLYIAREFVKSCDAH